MTRSARGQGIIALSMMVALIILPLLGILAFEVSRYQHGMQELQSVCDSAALAGAAMLVTSRFQKPADRMKRFQEATVAAENAFKSSFKSLQSETQDVLGGNLKKAVNVGVNGTLKLGTAPGDCTFKVEAVDPATLKVIAADQFNAKAIRLTAEFSTRPAWDKFCGISSLFPIYRKATAGVPMSDVLVCMDVSGSMDDSTRVSLVNRRFNLPIPYHQDLIDLYNKYVPLKNDLIAYSAKYPFNSQKYPLYTNGVLTGYGPPQPPNDYEKNYCLAHFYNPAKAAWDAYIARRVYYGQQLNPNFGKVEYGQVASGTLNDIVTRPGYPYGTVGNCLFPQNLNEINTFVGSPDGNPSLPFFNARERYFQETGSAAILNPPPLPPPVTACQINTQPGFPSNYLCYCPPAPQGFSDIVVHVDGRANDVPQQQPLFGSLGPISPQAIAYRKKRGAHKGETYLFNGIGYLVEAARGNLEPARFNQLKTLFQNNISAGELPSSSKEGYQDAYFEMASQYCQPVATAVDALENFYQALNGAGSSVKFGLVSFETACATSSPGFTNTVIHDIANKLPGNIAKIDIDSTSPGPATAKKYPILMLPLSDLQDPGVANVNDPYASGQLSMNDIFEKYIVPLRSTNIAAALNQGLSILDKSPRKSYVRQVIVLITDGVPTVDLNGNPNPAAGEQLARDAAALARARQIPIFTIGIAQNQTIQARQDLFLSATSPGGLATISGNGAKYFSVSQATMASGGSGQVNAISAAFLQVARGLVQLLD
ncbi:hypothetical protein BH10CYA1_BH10CYA1_18450 [soil metagenome]